MERFAAYKRLLAIGITLLLLTCGFSRLTAQTPFVAVYFDENLRVAQKDIAGRNVRDTLYVAARNFNSLINAIQFQISYPSVIGWEADFDILGEDAGGIVIGNTPNGIAIGFHGPVDATGTLLILKVDFLWLGKWCLAIHEIVVCCVEASAWPGFDIIEGVGLTALICAPWPTEESTWGRVKALYTE